MKYKLIIDKEGEEEVVVRSHAPSALTQRIEDLVRSHSGEDCLVGYRDGEMRKLYFDKIECITVIERRVTAVDREGEHYHLRDSLRDLETRLPSYFIRINMSALANERHIFRFVPAFGGGVDAVFSCGFREYVSRRCFSRIRRRYEEK
ncbi:MAG: LytTR family transcriptional regulator [Clostridia bacterium]|nr:LytTR family transcriptional regulator [Clostridia bacterium]